MISIIVPIFNVEKYLPQCIDSIINQTYRDIEIILVDDGSPDRCPEICDAYAGRDDRIRVVHQQNSGVSVARNAGLKIAKGDFIGFVDPDDWIAPEMYEAMFSAIQQNQVDFVICGYEYCNEDGSVDEKRRYKRKDPEKLSQKDIMRRMSDMPPTVRHVVWNKLFRLDFAKGILFPEELRASEDVWYLAEYLKKIKQTVFIHEPYYYNRVRGGSATHGGIGIQDLAKSFQMHDHMYQSIVSLYPDLRDYSQAFLLDVYLLKYNEAKKRAQYSKESACDNTWIAELAQMRKAIHKEGFKALCNKEIYWKTRIAYLLA